LNGLSDDISLSASCRSIAQILSDSGKLFQGGLQVLDDAGGQHIG
jgi:hypothetical protein